MQENPSGVSATVLAADEFQGRPAARPLGVGQAPRRRGADFYDTILWRLLPSDAGERQRGFAVGLTGCGSRSGVSTVAANVAIRAADHRVGPALVVDANFHRPRLDRVFRVHDALGFGDLLAGRCELAEALHPSGVADLTVMPTGTKGIVDRVSVDQHSIDTLMKELLDQFRFVVFDLPQQAEMRHSLLVARGLDAVLMVIRAEGVRPRAARAALETLERDGVNTVGAVVTQQKNYVPRWFQRWL